MSVIRHATPALASNCMRPQCKDWTMAPDLQITKKSHSRRHCAALLQPCDLNAGIEAFLQTCKLQATIKRANPAPAWEHCFRHINHKQISITRSRRGHRSCLKISKTTCANLNHTTPAHALKYCCRPTHDK